MKNFHNLVNYMKHIDAIQLFKDNQLIIGYDELGFKFSFINLLAN